MAETSGLLNRRRALKLYRGFESLSLRHQSWRRPTRSSDWRAGPFSTSPSIVKRDPWHGQSQLLSAVFHATSHFMCVQTGETGVQLAGIVTVHSDFAPLDRHDLRVA